MEELITAFPQFIKDHGPIISLLTFLVGLLLGNYLAIGRDKRKEFNAIVKPIRFNLLQQIKILESGQIMGSLVTKDDFVLLSMYLRTGVAKKLNKELIKYEMSQQNCGHTGEDGSFVIDDLAEYIKISHKLLAYAQFK